MERVRFLLGWGLALWLCINTACEEEPPGIDEPVSSEGNEKEDQQENPTELDDEGDELENTETPFPQTKSIQEVRSLVLSTAKQPEKESIDSCLEEVKKLSETAISTSALREAKMSLQETINEKRIEYHWCFLHRLIQLDDELKKSDQTIQEKVQLLFDSFKDVWLLANALDIISESKKYYRISREFYILFNKEYLGRDLTPAIPRVSSELELPNTPPKVEQTD